MAHDVFISYCSNDKATADAVCAMLESRGVHCWIAPRDVLPGEEYASALVRALRDSRIMVLVFSSGANKSQQVLREVERAVSKGLTILPLRIENIAPSAAMEYYISSRHWLDALTPPLERHLVQLAETVAVLLSRPVGGEAAGERVQAVKAFSPEAPGEPAQSPRSASATAARTATSTVVLDLPPERAAVSASIPSPASRLKIEAPALAESQAGELTISHVLKLIGTLRAGDLLTLVGVTLCLVAAVFLGGWILRGAIRPVAAQPIASPDPVEAARQLQDSLVKRPSIQAFEDFLRAAQTKQWSEAYGYLGPSWKEGSDGVAKPDDLARIYRRTVRHDFNYFIPTLVTDSREEYNADLTFSDAIPAFPVRDELTSLRVPAVLQPSQLSALTEELARELPSDYVVPSEKKAQIPSLVRDYVNQMTLRDLVLRDDMIEVMGKNLRLEPIVSHDNYQGARAATPKERFFKVVLVKEQGKWLVDSYDSFMVEKR